MKVLPINPRSSSRQNPGLLRSGKAVHQVFPGMGWGSGPEVCEPPFPELTLHGVGAGRGLRALPRLRGRSSARASRAAATALRAPGRPAVSPAPTRARRLTGRARPAPPVRAAGAAGWGEEARRETPGLSSRFALPPRPAPRPDLAPLLLRREQITSQEIAERSGESKARQICLHPENRVCCSEGRSGTFPYDKASDFSDAGDTLALVTELMSTWARRWKSQKLKNSSWS
nr:uncharacterized protein LOC118967653 [Manis javanica]